MFVFTGEFDFETLSLPTTVWVVVSDSGPDTWDSARSAWTSPRSAAIRAIALTVPVPEPAPEGAGSVTFGAAVDRRS